MSELTTKILDKIKSTPPIVKAGTLFVLLAIMAALFAWYDHKPVLSKTAFTAVPKIAAVENIPKVPTAVQFTHIKTIPKKTLEKKITLPPEVSDDEDTEVTDTADIPPSENGTQVITTINKVTGDTKILAKEKEAPLFAFENKKLVGVGYGIGTEGPVGTVYGQWTFARVGNVHISARAEINASQTRAPEAKVMATAEYRW